MTVPRSNASHDQNRTPTLMGVSTADGTTPVPVEVDPTTGQLQVSSTGGGGSGTQYAEGATTSPATGTVALGRYQATPPSLTDGQLSSPQLDSSGNLKVTGSLSVGGTTDNSAYTAGSGTGTPSMAFYHSTVDTVTDGRAATLGMTNKRALYTNLQNASGTEVGTSTTPLQVSVANTAANATAIKTDGSAVTQPVSGTFWQSTQPVSLATNTPTLQSGSTTAVTQATGTNLHTVVDSGSITADTELTTADLDTGAGTDTRAVVGLVGSKSGGGVLIPGDATKGLAVDLTATGANTTALKVDGSAVTQPVSLATNTPTLQSGSTTAVTQATAANLNATVVGTGTFAVQATLAAETTKVIGVVRTADGSGNLLTSTTNALDVNLKTSALSNLSTNVAQINAVTPLMGNGVTGTGSQRVTVASDNTPFPVKIDQTTPGTTNLVALAANQSVNVAQMNGVATTMGNGVAGTGVQRVAIASDNTAFPIKIDQTTPGTTNAVVDTPVTSGGLLIITGSVGATATAIKASAGQLYGYHLFNTTAAVAYVQIFNVAAGSVTLGTTAPTMSIGIPASGGATVNFDKGIAFGTAMSYACTTTRAGLTGATCDVNFFYK